MEVIENLETSTDSIEVEDGESGEGLSKNKDPDSDENSDKSQVILKWFYIILITLVKKLLVKSG